ncbi:MAG: ATP-binding protein [Atopobiaceae bacterium]|nr:ATP-binding protein [Atopobiaceae bacterium]
MAYVSRWDSVSRTGWSFAFDERNIDCFVFELTRVPDFSEPRFSYLAEEKDARATKVAQRQLQMLRQLHSLGHDWGLSLRIVKDSALTLYLVVRGPSVMPDGISRDDMSNYLKMSLMRDEYTFSPVDSDVAFDLTWANEGVEIMKQEEALRGAAYPAQLGMESQQYYVPFAWVAADNNMQHICDALMHHAGKACVEVTLVPTAYLDDERDWMSTNILRLKESMNGETLRDRNGRVLWRGEKIPGLKPSVDNCEKINKQYATSAVFLSSVHVFASSNASALADALLANSVRNMGKTVTVTKGSNAYACLARAYRFVDVTVEVPSLYWSKRWREQNAPFRAQRLPRLVSVEEASNFFRIPIPVQAGFPGFGLDTGLGDSPARKAVASPLSVGTYLDVAGGADTASFDVQQFAKHGLIVGVPGSGKTTAMFSILHQLWDRPAEERVPFIVLEPAKTEYRSLKRLPAFSKDMLVFTLGDEDTSPFRFNPLEVLPGIRLENHISRLQACFVGAFDLFDPLPIFLEQAIRRTYLEQGWYDDSRGGEPGLITPTMADLCRNAEFIVEHSGFDPKMKSDFKASLLERLNSLRRGSKGRMLDCQTSVSMDDLMGKPVILELDSLNGDEKSLLMMFLLSYVFEYCKARRRSGSPLRHLLVVEEAHNLISAQGNGGSDNRANPKAQTIELFVNMLAEMRALGQGILIADQLPTAIAPQAVKQTNVKLLMRVTARDDREEIGNTMDLNEDQMHQVVNFKTGHAYLYHEGEDRVRMIRMPNFKGEHNVEEPPTDDELKTIMADYELGHRDLYLPFAECERCCERCNRRTRNQAEAFVHQVFSSHGADAYQRVFSERDGSQLEKLRNATSLCGVMQLATSKEAARIAGRYGEVGEQFGLCVYIHMLHAAQAQMLVCKKGPGKKCGCGQRSRDDYLERFKNVGGR